MSQTRANKAPRIGTPTPIPTPSATFPVVCSSEDSSVEPAVEVDEDSGGDRLTALVADVSSVLVAGASTPVVEDESVVVVVVVEGLVMLK